MQDEGVLFIHLWIEDVQDSQGVSASEMRQIGIIPRSSHRKAGLVYKIKTKN